ncbi:15437_t:CDS:2, partial [Gigaspora rosea]
QAAIQKIQEILNSTSTNDDKLDTIMIDVFKTTSQLVKTTSEMIVETE